MKLYTLFCDSVYLTTQRQHCKDNQQTISPHVKFRNCWQEVVRGLRSYDLGDGALAGLVQEEGLVHVVVEVWVVQAGPATVWTEVDL